MSLLTDWSHPAESGSFDFMNSLLEPLPDGLRNFLGTRPRWIWAVHFLWQFSQKWGADGCPLYAAALAFFGLMSLFPITLAGTAMVARFVAGNPRAAAGVQQWVMGFFPGVTGREISNALVHTAVSVDPKALGILAIVPLLWSGRAYFDTLATVLNQVWPNTQPRSFWSHQSALWGTFIGAGGLWILSLVATFALRFMRGAASFLPDLVSGGFSMLWEFAGMAVGWMLTVFMFWLIYHFLPNRQTRQRHRVVWGAALLAALLWEAAKWAFGAFMGNLARYEATYGSVAGVVLTLLWIYFSSLIILAGAEAAAAYEATQSAARSDSETSHGTAN